MVHCTRAVVSHHGDLYVRRDHGHVHPEANRSRDRDLALDDRPLAHVGGVVDEEEAEVEARDEASGEMVEEEGVVDGDGRGSLLRQ